MGNHDHWCGKCLKWGMVLYLLHFVVHGVLFLVAPVLGWLSFGVF